MIVYWLLELFSSLKFAFFAAIPTIETPAWIATRLPEILRKIAGFNYYLPVLDCFLVVIGCLGITLAWKVAKVMLGIVQIDLNK